MGRALVVVPAALALVAALTAPAQAAVGIIQDPVGDAVGNGLDITRAALDNRDDQIVVRVRFDALKRSDLIVSVDPRGAQGLRMISEYRPKGQTENYLVPFAFSNRGAGPDDLDCPGYRVRWDTDTERAILRLPSSCLQDGDYGAVRFAVLTERGADADYAPENRREVSAFIARG
ncbi:MAG: hypothetical protein ACXWDM_05360 [Nocardioides sp.]